MDERTNTAVTKETIPVEVETYVKKNSNPTIMLKQDDTRSSSREDNANLLTKSESIDTKLGSTKPFTPLMETHELSAMGDGCYENQAFKEDLPRKAGTSSSSGNIQRTSNPSPVSNDTFCVGASNFPRKQSIEHYSPAKKDLNADYNSRVKPVSNNFVLSSPSDQEDTSTNPTATFYNDDASVISSEHRSARQLFHAARSFITNRLRTSSDSSSDSRAERSRDWVFMSVVTLVVGALDKLFDVLFLLTLFAEKEWVFLAFGLTFTIVSTITTSFFAAQSFWLQSSQIPTWSLKWIELIPDQKTVFLHEKFSKPINRRILPESSRFAEPDIIYDTHDGSSSSRSNSTSTHSHDLEDDQVLMTNMRQESEKNDGNNNSQGEINERFENRDKLPHRKDDQISNVRIEGGEFSARRGCTTDDGLTVDGYHSTTRKGDTVTPQRYGTSRIDQGVQETSEQIEIITEAASSGRSTPSDSVDCGFEQPMKQQFQPWVRGFVIALFCAGILPESVLIIHLTLYVQAGPQRRLICKMLRETWFVQSLKLAEALLESLPQIHLKMFYYLTVYREYDVSGILDDEEIDWFSSQFLGLLVNAASICMGLIAILHVHIVFKIMAFMFLFINLATRIAVCASLDFVTVAGVYFIPFGVALFVSAASMVVITVLECGHYRTGIRKLERYIGVPVMRTFCKPPVDVPGMAVSAVFVVASIVCAYYINDGSLTLIGVVVVGGAFIGQVVPGLAWYATGISREDQENKRRTSVVQDNMNQNLPGEAGQV